jgi:hypothetical protein
MRFIIKLALGAMIFNAMLILLYTSGFIPNATEQNKAYNVTSGSSEYDITGISIAKIINPFNDARSSAIFVILIGIGVAGIFGGINVPLFAGISILCGYTLSILNNCLTVFTNLSDGYPVVSDLITILFIVIGVVALFSVGSLLAGRSDVD